MPLSFNVMIEILPFTTTMLLIMATIIRLVMDRDELD